MIFIFRQFLGTYAYGNPKRVHLHEIHFHIEVFIIGILIEKIVA